jgi:hypothetical protein
VVANRYLPLLHGRSIRETRMAAFPDNYRVGDTAVVYGVHRVQQTHTVAKGWIDPTWWIEVASMGQRPLCRD